DNRFVTFSRSGAVLSSHATNRTATFVFYLGERYFGVITAYVQGREAENYHFTSALPVTLLKLLAPTLLTKWDERGTPQKENTAALGATPNPAAGENRLAPGSHVTPWSFSSPISTESANPKSKIANPKRRARCLCGCRTARCAG